LYTEHGSDFTSRHLEQVGADLKIRLVFSMQGKPRGRSRIERFFSTMDEMFLCELDGYAPPGGGVRGKPTLTLAELDSRLRTFLLHVYHSRDGAETKTPPAERWEANGFLPRMPESLEQLDLLLVQAAKAGRIHRDGIHFHGLRYISPTLATYVGESVRSVSIPATWARFACFTTKDFCAAPYPLTSPVQSLMPDNLQNDRQGRSRSRRDVCGSEPSVLWILSCRTARPGAARALVRYAQEAGKQTYLGLRTNCQSYQQTLARWALNCISQAWLEATWRVSIAAPSFSTAESARSWGIAASVSSRSRETFARCVSISWWGGRSATGIC
jgi:hypothetical protein